MYSRPETNRGTMPDFWNGFNEEPVKRSPQEIQDEVQSVQEDADLTLDEIDALLNDLTRGQIAAAPGGPSATSPEGRADIESELMPLQVSSEVRDYVEGISDEALAEFVTGALVSQTETSNS